MRIKKNDIVKVVSGNYKGAEGRVLKVFPDSQKLIVEKVNMIKRHTRQTSQGDQGGILEKEAPIHLSNVKLVCPKCGKPTRVQIKTLSDGKRVRECKLCHEIISDEE
ncbi:MAG: 50S ribosomal protein L24 [Candidatus Latescibacteria bacterium 4484_7]|nr:MAG: 50S ribosomal protein L24 [Candidatus Latescibacteria bacterium 4484_7]RKZ09133.1 MAG: 50S ribosomal protein L24 [bacterium]